MALTKRLRPVKKIWDFDMVPFTVEPGLRSSGFVIVDGEQIPRRFKWMDSFKVETEQYLMYANASVHEIGDFVTKEHKFLFEGGYHIYFEGGLRSKGDILFGVPYSAIYFGHSLCKAIFGKDEGPGGLSLPENHKYVTKRINEIVVSP